MEKMASRPEVRVLVSIVLRSLRDHHKAEGRAESTKSSFRGADLGSRYQKFCANENFENGTSYPRLGEQLVPKLVKQ